MKKRRSLTPDMGIPPVDPGSATATNDAHSMRRGGPRRELTERVFLVGANMKQREGWALNVSRGGVRIVLEELVELGEEYEVTVGDDASLTRKARVVWLQEEPDGLIAGMEFIFGNDMSRSGSHRFASDLPPPPVDETSKKPV